MFGLANEVDFQAIISAYILVLAMSPRVIDLEFDNWQVEVKCAALTYGAIYMNGCVMTF